MGITRLMNLLKEKCPNALRRVDLKTYIGSTFALDASMVFIISHASIGNVSISNLNSADQNRIFNI